MQGGDAPDADAPTARADDDALRAWAEATDDPVVIVDDRGHLRRWNAAAAGFLAPVALTAGAPLSALLHRLGVTASHEIVRQILSVHAPDLELLVEPAGGPRRNLFLRLSRWRAGDRTFVGARLEDRTRRRAAEEELTQLASFPELDPRPILELTPDGEITYSNAAADDLLDGGHLDAILAAIAELTDGVDDRGAHGTREVQSGAIWIELVVHYIAEWSTIRVYAHEITERKLAEAAAAESHLHLERRVRERTRDLAEVNRQLAREIVDRRRAERLAIDASQVKSAFLANMSHELRTPLNAIIGYAELLREERDEGDGEREDLGRILGAARHLLGLINNVLDISKIEAGKMDLLFEEVAVAPLLDDVCATVEGLVTDRGNALVRAWPEDLGALETDATKVRQILVNLLGNAAKFTDGGTITLSAGRDGDGLRVAVRDTGVGIPADVLPRLFRPFEQADESTARRYGGTGLGLAISFEYAQLLGGDLVVDSAEGVGSTFTLTLPAKPPAPTTASDPPRPVA